MRNKRLRAELIEAAKGGILPKDFLLAVMRDESRDIELRIEAAKAVAPYLHAKLVSVDARVDQPVMVEIIRF